MESWFYSPPFRNCCLKLSVKREQGTGHHGLGEDVHFPKPVTAAHQADGSADTSSGCGHQNLPGETQIPGNNTVIKGTNKPSDQGVKSAAVRVTPHPPEIPLLF